MRSLAFNMDCMEGMSQYPDKYFDLAIVDPPYGIGISNNSFRQKQDKKNWGGNYFILPPSQGFIIWDKKQPFNFSSAMCEYAWISIQKPAKIFSLHVVTAENNKIHPTQKPVKLYKWILTNYAKPGNKILDTHLGSGSSRIAAWDMGFDFVGYELDKDYFDAQEKRFNDFKMQTKLF